MKRRDLKHASTQRIKRLYGISMCLITDEMIYFTTNYSRVPQKVIFLPACSLFEFNYFRVPSSLNNYRRVSLSLSKIVDDDVVNCFKICKSLIYILAYKLLNIHEICIFKHIILLKNSIQMMRFESLKRRIFRDR